MVIFFIVTIGKYGLGQWLSAWDNFVNKGTLGDVWRHLWLPQLGRGGPPAPSRWGPGMLTREFSSPTVNRAQAAANPLWNAGAIPGASPAHSASSPLKNKSPHRPGRRARKPGHHRLCRSPQTTVTPLPRPGLCSRGAPCAKATRRLYASEEHSVGAQSTHRC